MSERLYEVIDDTGNAIATRMDLRTTLLLMKAYSEEYYNEQTVLTLKEIRMVETEAG